MKLHPRVTRSVVELVKRFEGLRRRAGRLADGGWTIGYGHTRSAREGGVVSPQDAEALLYYDLSEVAQKVEAWTFTPLNQNQFEALIAFAFNIGVDNFRQSTVLKRVNEGQHLRAAAALELWRRAEFDGEDLVIDALVRRRAAEKAHYLTPPEGFRPSPTPILRPTFDRSLLGARLTGRAGGPAVMVDAPLEGRDAAAALAPGSEAEEVKTGASPLLAVTGAGVATAQLHQLFPEKSPVVEEELDPPFTPEALKVFASAGGATPLADAPFGTLPALELNDAPPPPFGAGSIGSSVKGGASAALLRGKTDDAVSNPFNASSAGPVLVSIAKPLDAPSETPKIDAAANTQAPPAAHPGPLHDRSMIFLSIGLLGAALFFAALFSIFSGKATPANLVIGLMGILLMTPAGGYHLMQVFERRDGSRGG